MSNNETRAGNDGSSESQIRPPVIEALIGGTERRASPPMAPNGKRAVLCETQGAMSQQSSDAGYFSTPQKLLQLVGYRDPNAAYTWHRPRRNGTG